MVASKLHHQVDYCVGVKWRSTKRCQVPGIRCQGKWLVVSGQWLATALGSLVKAVSGKRWAERKLPATNRQPLATALRRVTNLLLKLKHEERRKEVFEQDHRK